MDVRVEVWSAFPRISTEADRLVLGGLGNAVTLIWNDGGGYQGRFACYTCGYWRHIHVGGYDTIDLVY